MFKKTTTNITPENRKQNLGIKLGIIGAAVALVVGSVPVLDSVSSDALTTDGKFCVQATSDGGKFVGTRGYKGCGEGSSPTEPSTPVITPSSPAAPAPVPDITAAGVCALPDAGNTIYAIASTRKTIEAFKIDADGKANYSGTTGTVTAGSSSNGLALTRLGKFFYTTNGRDIRSFKPGEGDAAVDSANAFPGTLISGAAIVYKGKEEYYTGAVQAPAGGDGSKVFTVYRYSPDAARTGVVFNIPVSSVSSTSDFAFDRSGTLKMLVGSGSSDKSTILGTLSFSKFADLPGVAKVSDPGLSIDFDSTKSLDFAAGSGVAFIGTDKMAVSSSRALTIWKIDGAEPTVLSTIDTTTLNISDLADCG